MPKKIVLIDLRYPYGKKNPYMSGSIADLAARMMAVGHTIHIVDLNIDNVGDDRVKHLFAQADIIGISVIGSPYIPQAIDLAGLLTSLYYNIPILVGGQVIKKLRPGQFEKLFQGTNAVQIRNHADLVSHFGTIPPPMSMPYEPTWRRMGDARLRQYLEREFTLVVSQGCKFNCGFCGAAKAQREQFVEIDNFRGDLRFLATSAKSFGLRELRCYTTSLDFFQNPEKVAPYMEALAEVQAETGVAVRVRCLSCMTSFLQADKQLPDFANLVRRSGLWCVGFGADGTDESVWQAQKKRQNHLNDIAVCLKRCLEIGVRPELLMVLGFPEDTMQSSWKNFKNSIKYVWSFPGTIIRPYLAKPFIPGNEGWTAETERVWEVVKDPDLFYHLDFCALGSRLTHPRFWHRLLCNLTYLGIIGTLTPFNRCTTFPLLPQGDGGWRARIARTVNRLMPFDR